MRLKDDIKSVWLSIDSNGQERMWTQKPQRNLKIMDNQWWYGGEVMFLPDRTIEKLLGYKLRWEDECVEYFGD